MSNSTFINLHELMHTKGWIPEWEFNEVVDLYKYNNYKTIAECEGYKTDLDANGAWIYHLGSLTSGYLMFYDTTIASFSGDLSSLTSGSNMFYSTPLESFSGDLSSLTYGYCMFQNTPLTLFNDNLSKLTNGVQMFSNTALTSFNGDLSKLTDGLSMFYNTPLESFSGDLSSLTNGQSMFRKTAITTFNGDLSRMTNGHAMFYRTPLESFSGDLSSLTNDTNGNSMFSATALTSFDGDLSSLIDGKYMFCVTALESFNGDLSSLSNGNGMFSQTHARTYTIDHYKMVNGVKKQVTTSVTSNGLKSFNSNLSSLINGYHMFGYSATICSPLSEESIMNIADTINDINGLELTGDGAGQLWLGYDTTITDTTNIMKYCDKIADKGWRVFLNGSQYVSADSGSAALIDGESSTTPIPYYYKPLQVTNEDIAEFVDGDNNYYIIVGGQHVFGDDISTYGIFTSFEHAIELISLDLGLTPYEKPIEE